ncbi:MAG TPA: sugar phosphate nucleotidyltransferase [Bacteroidales bacterium]|jgi:glucose-1-phosphate thymidylyltransferase|nr:NTP transferase domain-containing protein [Bacteroidales bacterium]HNZ42136.1 sugar phosphate nucleotidyltransferase [Bacteroidales bacterium]HPB24324.1 sugar phosphate nucleotidyltransferase [Bacteroidales bacterium]HQN15333.1 sugar phosphate nucleotidyltransferase [Bacteroidales bacterium]HQP14700.1 sugar phosphate nucleotidyltransferase [Bacteroidales bacterium]
MKIIIPMAGMGKRMRPHTLTIPKPLIPVAGKPIVQHLAESLINSCSQPVEEISFIVGNFGEETEKKLLDISVSLGVKGKICYQKEALGTAHAVLCAAESLDGPVIIAFADTLFKAGFSIDSDKDSIIWVQKVENPSQFGVVTTAENNTITGFVEKPKEFVSDLAIIGIYYFKDGKNLRNELQYLIDNKVIKSGEYQLTDALKNMLDKGLGFYAGHVDEWLDCGNKDATVHTNQRVLEMMKEQELIAPSAVITNSVIKKPCFIGENVVISDAVIGPHVSVGKNTHIQNSIITNSIIQENSTITDANLDNSMIGSFVDFKGKLYELSIGDYTTMC